VFHVPVPKLFAHLINTPLKSGLHQFQSAGSHQSGHLDKLNAEICHFNVSKFDNILFHASEVSILQEVASRLFGIVQVLFTTA
jgi:hypothetical protein